MASVGGARVFYAEFGCGALSDYQTRAAFSSMCHTQNEISLMTVYSNQTRANDQRPGADLYKRHPIYPIQHTIYQRPLQPRIRQTNSMLILAAEVQRLVRHGAELVDLALARGSSRSNSHSVGSTDTFLRLTT